MRGENARRGKKERSVPKRWGAEARSTEIRGKQQGKNEMQRKDWQHRELAWKDQRKVLSRKVGYLGKKGQK